MKPVPNSLGRVSLGLGFSSWGKNETKINHKMINDSGKVQYLGKVPAKSTVLSTFRNFRIPPISLSPIQWNAFLESARLNVEEYRNFKFLKSPKASSNSKLTIKFAFGFRPIWIFLSLVLILQVSYFGSTSFPPGAFISYLNGP